MSKSKLFTGGVITAITAINQLQLFNLSIIKFDGDTVASVNKQQVNSIKIDIINDYDVLKYNSNTLYCYDIKGSAIADPLKTNMYGKVEIILKDNTVLAFN